MIDPQFEIFSSFDKLPYTSLIHTKFLMWSISFKTRSRSEDKKIFPQLIIFLKSFIFISKSCVNIFPYMKPT